MGAPIVIKGGSVLDAYKEYLLSATLSLAVWKGNYPDLWADAGGQTLSLNGRSYFGGSFAIDSVNTAAKEELLEMTGIDAEGIEEIRAVYYDGDVRHVDLRLNPRQTFTLDGLRYFLNEKVHDTLVDENITEFETYHFSEWSNTQNSNPLPSFPPKISPSAQVNEGNLLAQEFELFGANVGSSSDDVNEAIELLYRLTSWFEDYETVTTTVIEEIDTSGIEDMYRYKTIITISLTNLDYLTSYSTTEALYEDVDLGDTIADYSYTDVDGGYSWMKFALLLWNLEFPLQMISSDQLSIFKSLEGNDTVIYHDDRYWIDTEVWKKSHPTHCLLTLARLIDIKVVQDKSGFWHSFVGKLLRFIFEIINMVVKVLGEFVYSVIYIWGGFILKIMANKNIIDKDAFEKYRKIFVKVAGTIALMVLTSAISTQMQAAELAAAKATALEVGTVEAYAAVGELSTAMAAELTALEMVEMLSEVVGAGINEYQMLTTDTAVNTKIIEEIEDAKDPLSFVYEEDEPVDMAEYFIDSVYDMMDVYADMDI